MGSEFLTDLLGVMISGTFCLALLGMVILETFFAGVILLGAVIKGGVSGVFQKRNIHV